MIDYPEAFDDEISSNVSLSKILDAFICDNSNHKIILEFLKSHDLFFKEIISNSFYWTRLFQLDFILKYNSSELDYILKKLKYIPGKHAAYCCWQILNSSSGCLSSIKYRFRREITWILDTFKTSHPYSSWMSKSIIQYDQILSKAFNKKMTIEEISNIFNNINDDEFRRFIVNLNGSIFKYRFLQYDFFNCLSEIKQWIFISSIDNIEALDFFIQILDSNESVEVKHAVIQTIQKTSRMNIDEKYESCLYSRSFGEMMMNMTITGNINPIRLMILFIRSKNFKRLNEWKEFNVDEFNDILNIGDLIDFEIKEYKKEKK